MTPLHWAADKGHAEVVSNLAEQGADVNATDVSRSTPLHCATQGHYLAARELLLWEADVDAEDSDGWTALHHAASYGEAEIVRELLARGADATKVDRKGRTAGQVAKDHSNTKIYDLLR
eukprot:TRINITY_DN28386_c0_g1_i1.p1 TRINITY_DN28386_c0_g1~~TRINITY_DN28386_c0_g1_i1.p1  ORF type:complete len:119 (+),score=23.23 TRINITY_DN28386_c0_g1_i1:145-501(+)